MTSSLHHPGATGAEVPIHHAGQPGYDELVQPWNVAVRRTPYAVAGPRTAAEVAAAVRWAAERDVAVAVQSTGHGAGGSADDALLISTRALDECTVRSDGTIRVGAGVRWRQVLDAAAPAGLAPLCGSAPHVGVAGMLTGGGIGPAARTFGFSSDSVRAVELVTADGTWRRATPDTEPDLFWAVRGGKGAVGLVTALELEAPRLSRLLAGAVYIDGTEADRVLKHWATWSRDLPRQASTSLALLQLPPIPGVPAPLAGRLTVAIRFAWVGDPADGERCFAPMRALATPILDNVEVRPWASLGAVHADPVDPMPVHEDHALLTGLDDAAVDRLLAHAGPEADNVQVIVELRRLGGALADPAAHPSAVSHRDAAYSLVTIGVAAPVVGEQVRAHAGTLIGAMAPWAHAGTLVNFAPYADPRRLARAYDDATRGRLLAVAHRFDPARTLVAHRDLRASALELEVRYA